MDLPVSQIPRNSDWPVSFPLQSAVEFVSASGLRPETIVSRLSWKLGGRLAHCIDSYRTIGAQRIHLDMLRNGYAPPWLKRAPWQKDAHRNPRVSQKAADVLDVEVQGLLEKGAIVETSPVLGQFVSSYFAVPKSKRVPDKWRPILNLKKFNRYVCHIYFQMEELKCVRKWFRHGSMCAGLDIKDAFLHVPMDARVKKFLRFEWKGKLYEWQVLPFGLKCSPRILTRMVNPIMKFLCGRGISLMPLWTIFLIRLVAGARRSLRSM